MKNFYAKMKKKLTNAVLLAGALFMGYAHAQTTLAAGDIAFTAYDSTITPVASGAGDVFSFVLLTNISSGTIISFTDQGYQGSGWQAAAATESAITWTSGTALARGTEIYIVGLSAYTYNPTTSTSASNGTVALTSGTSVNGLSLSAVGDQVIAFQGGSGSITGSGAYAIAGINYFYTAASTAAGWNVGAANSPNASLMPPGLTGGTNALYTGSVTGNTLAQSGKFNCSGMPVSTAANVRTAVMNAANWVLSTSSVGQYSGCLFIASTPVITGNPPNRTLCAGGNTTFSISATGATSYQWYQNTGSGFTALTDTAPFSNVTTSTLTITGVNASLNGTQYRCVAINAGGSATSNSATLTVLSITANGIKTDVTCNGGSNGTINLTPAGGIAPYTYNWGGGITTEDRTGLAAGTYTVTITDNIGCTTTSSFVIGQSASTVSGTTVVTNIACNGGTTGSINLTPVGGSAPYTFNWGGGITTEDRTGLAAGTYTVIITDANGCTATVNATVTQPATAVSGTTIVTNIACNGGTTGSINLTPVGGSAPYTFNWGGGITTEDRTGLAAGTYTVIITDANGCTATVNATVTQPTSAVSGTTVVTNIACNGGSTGAINLTPAGGTAPYTFNWGGGITTEDRTGLAAGTYTVVITDVNGCTATVSRTVTQPTALVAATSQTNIACNGGATGTAGVTVSGGTGPYTYSWSPSGGTAATATGLSAGTYTVTVTDANGCTLSRTFTITQPASTVSGTTVVTNIACNGGSTGAINLTPAGGTAPYTFNWGGGVTTEDRTGLAAGTYTVIITDVNGCTATVNATVTQPASTVSGTTVVTNIACNGGSTGAINLTPAGGTAPYTFNWGGGVTMEDRTGLAAGTYTVIITDVNGCTATVNATVTQPASAVSGTTVVTNIACNGGSTGAINLTPAGGTAPYTFNWGGGITTEDRTGLAAGTYTVIITDVNGCTATVSRTVTQPTALVAATSQTNIACNGGATGIAGVTVSGGTGPYTYSWSPSGGTAATATGLSAGTYTVTVTDANGCTLSRTFTITQPASAVSGTTVVTNIACNGGSTGAINLTPAGGTAPYTFNWGGGVTTEDRTGLAAGTYTVIITDVNGCTATVTATVTQPATAVSGTTVVTNIACNGASNGSINLTPVGGSAPYTFNWGGGITTEDRTGLAAGTYTVIITDANGCTATVNATVTQPTALSGSVTQTNVACNGGSTGSATVTVTGGTAPYTYSWSPSGGTAATATGLVAGTYTVTVTDANGCTLTRTVTITQSSAVSGTTVVTNIACNGGSTGSINLTPVGGSAPYTFNWGGGITTEDRTGLAAGTYTVIITDANGCTATVNATVTQPTALSGSVAQTNVACNGGSTGSATVTVTGGTAPYTYSWSPSGGTAATATGLVAGTYTVTVTDANGCTLTRTVTITQSSAVSGTTVVTNIACNGGSTGSINLTPVGGSAPYTFNWGGGITTEDRTGLAAGTYTVIITDANGCTATVNATVTQPTALSGSVTQTNVACNGGSTGSATITVTGGTAPYTYSWSPSGGTAATATGLAAGTYTVTVTDANGCTLTRTVTITQSSAVSGTTVVTNIACNGGSTGSINLTPIGGSAPYTFNWGGGITTEDRTGLAAGTYTVIITDANGCTATVNATVTQPATAVSGTTVVTNVACNGASNGSINLTPAGGTAPYTFNWGGGITTEDRTGLAAGTYTVIITDANGCTAIVNATVTQPATAVSGTTVVTNISCNGASNGSINLTPAGGSAPYTYNWGGGITTEDRTGLAAGTYTVIITDANGCTATVNATVTQPTALSGSVTQTNVACNGGSTGSATVTVTGGTAPYTYSWSPSGGTAATATGLAAGTYTVTVTDANGCTLTRTVTITQSSAVSGTTVVTNIACNGGSTGSINLTPVGGSAPYTFNWGGGITTEDRTGLAAGTYTVIITDANGCTATVNATVTQPTALSGSVTQTNVACNGGSTGSATVTVTGGTAPYTYSWSPSGGTAATATGLAAGTYTVTVTDANGCTLTRTVTITQSSAVSGTTVVTNIACNGGSTGSINLTPVGGSAPYTFNWGGGITTEDRTGLAAGTYTVIITDANGCTATVNAIVSQPATAVSGTTVVTNVACNGASNGSINLTPAGGTAPYTFNWGGGITTEDRTGLAAGTYTVIITDANGCTATVNATVTQPATAVSGTTVVTNVACNGASNGSINLTPAGGSAPYTFNWGGGITTEDRTGLAAGTYTVIITDANGCTATVNATVTQPATAVSGTTVVTNVACNGASNGSINLTSAGGSAPYTFNWGGGITTEDRTGLAAGTYTVIITDANGCTATVNATVTQPTALSGSVTQTNVACNGGSTGSATVTVTGGTAPYTYSWSPSGGTAATATGLAAGTYTVTVTDANGCTLTRTVTITQSSPVSGTTVVTNIACNGGSTGSINLTPVGGSAPYTFNWGGGVTTEDRTGLAAGTYTVIITDANGCTATVNATVTQPATAVSGTTVVTNVACNGASNGSINLTPAGGSAPYTFNWGGGITTEDRTGLAAGTYTVIITDANGCTATVNAIVSQPATAVSGTTVVTNVACNGASNGSINLTPAGGSAPYTFNWGGGITTEDRTGLAAGTYTVIITDANGCTATVNAIVSQPATAVSGTTVVTNVACNGASNGSINLTPAGGTAPYTFNWGGGITTEDRTGLAAGTYTVIITDANGCTATVNATVTQPTALSGSVTQTNVACNGGSTGSATVTVTGGTAPYTYSWSPSGGTAATATGLAAGTYTVTVTDANGCTLTRTVTITQSAVIGAPTGAAVQSFNAGNTLSVLVVNGQNIKWYASAANAANHTGSLAITTPIVNNTTYYATQTLGGCESTASLAVLAYNASLGVVNVANADSDMQIYPNPVMDILKVSGEEKIIKLIIFSADGRKVTEKVMTNGDRGINVSSFVQGVYVIQVFTKDYVKTFKFIKR